MSALLAIDTSEINICAEYGYNTRHFDKRPRVIVSDNYKSCMFLVHQQTENIPNRKEKYNNHFTLFRSVDTIVIVRTETTMVYRDNDAVLLYDVITLSSNITDRFKAEKNSWAVSFDRITYSNEKPIFNNFELISSGEWWFFDKGIILNGITKYVKDQECLNIFIYYELHPKFIVRSTSMNFANPWNFMNNNTITHPQPHGTTIENNTNNTLPKQPSSTLPFSYSVNATNDNANLSTNATSNTASSNTENTPIPNNSQNSFHTSTLASTILPMLNAASRPIISKNDTIDAPDVRYQAVIPTLYWLTTRAEELTKSDISYFLPQNRW